jgi:hypothetical protein
LTPSARRAVGIDFRRDLACNQLRDCLLAHQRVGRFDVHGLRPEIELAGAVDQLNGDA